MDAFRTKYGKGVMEAVGTAILLLTIQVAVADGGMLGGEAIGIVLMCIVYAGGPISGAHYNPAVSLSIMLRGKMSLHDMLVYMVFQIIGGTLGAIIGGTIAGKFAVFAIGTGTGMQAFLAEFVFTFILCFTVLGVATHSAAADNSYYGVAIGMVVLVGAVTVGPISGGAFNPAVAIGLCLADCFENGTMGMQYLFTTVVADLLGGVAAAGIFYIVAPDQFESSAASIGETTNLV
mmetsp:Transcript_51833/g.60566  ORF Transcript_51833/g.60566 Transcript_51833/m.60566 type:complete len:234 (+) Transcript_51833:99-800(+)|eukprot:CAMPEP_0194378510 /NCGR_PEP_ID=MMETSP0174-20130528/35718_1 /TAXON_ID=216777 /ORGANISM="Proboscia alata, Strain PI-D3" /LENGTH=233 /DNA_ID=CAMNT_0039160585 /DNA_START=62 /DNA_END=763 /DNA_ORIENTATION=+